MIELAASVQALASIEEGCGNLACKSAILGAQAKTWWVGWILYICVHSVYIFTPFYMAIVVIPRLSLDALMFACMVMMMRLAIVVTMLSLEAIAIALHDDDDDARTQAP